MLAIINGKVLTATGKNYDCGTVLVEDGKIAAVGDGKEVQVPAGAEIIDAAGKWVTPGLIDAHTHISAFGEPRARTGNFDVNEITTPVTAHLRGIDALNPFDVAITNVRKAGFTTCYTGPGSSNVIGGVGLSFKLKKANSVYDMAIPGSEQMKFALGENPKFVYGNQKKFPSSRMSIVAMLRQELYDAKVYSDELLEAEKEDGKPPKPNFKLDPLVPVVRGQRRCRIHCHRADDIITAIRVGEEYGLRISVEHCTEGYKIADILAEKEVTCVVGPLSMDLAKEETAGVRLETPVILHRAGVKNFCMSQDSCSGTRWLPSFIGMCIARGLPYEVALESVTINPAKLLELDDRLGSLEAGKDADIAIFSGDPFCNYTLCEMTVIDGVVYHNGEED